MTADRIDVSNFDIPLEIDNGGRIKTKLYNIGYSNACAVIFWSELSC
jgi:hypothetical protein